MIRAFNGKMPVIAPSAYVNEFAYVVGDVEIGENSGVWPGAVVRGDCGPIRIGKNCQIEDNSVLHSGTDLDIGDNVTIGHGAVIHCRSIGDNVLVGNNATLLDRVEVGANTIIGANSMVSSGQKIPENSFVVGVPAKIKSETASSVIERMEASRQDIHQRFIAEKGRPIFQYPDLVKRYKAEGL